jgi:hypothetical protein
MKQLGPRAGYTRDRVAALTYRYPSNFSANNKNG